MAQPFFAPLRHRVMETLARESKTLTLAGGDIVFSEGDQGDGF